MILLYFAFYNSKIFQFQSPILPKVCPEVSLQLNSNLLWYIRKKKSISHLQYDGNTFVALLQFNDLLMGLTSWFETQVKNFGGNHKMRMCTLKRIHFKKSAKVLKAFQNCSMNRFTFKSCMNLTKALKIRSTLLNLYLVYIY